VDSLNDKLTKDMRVHKKDKARILQENIALIQEINQLRREIRSTQDQQQARQQQQQPSSGGQSQYNPSAEEDPEAGGRRHQIEREMETQQEQIRALKAQSQLLARELHQVHEEH